MRCRLECLPPGGKDRNEAIAPVSVESLSLHADTNGCWFYCRIATLPGKGESPDAAARRISGDTVVHSTSWRYRPEGQVVLTFAVCPDPAPDSGSASPVLRTTVGLSPGRPVPRHMEIGHVAAHAVRHLAFLLGTDPVVGAALARTPRIAAALREIDPAPAGQQHG